VQGVGIDQFYLEFSRLPIVDGLVRCSASRWAIYTPSAMIRAVPIQTSVVVRSPTSQEFTQLAATIAHQDKRNDKRDGTRTPQAGERVEMLGLN
jgi:hypothetical protein